jgi:hypothetical protein
VLEEKGVLDILCLRPEDLVREKTTAESNPVPQLEKCTY